jgi:hypothetical protein
MILQFLRMFLDNFSMEDLDYLVTIAPAITPIAIELPDLSSYEYLIVNKKSPTEATTWDAIINKARPFRQPFPNERYLYRNGVIVIPLSTIGDVDAVARGIVNGTINLDTYMANYYARFDAIYTAELAVIEAQPNVTRMEVLRHQTAQGDYQNVAREFRSVVLRRVSEMRAGGT